MGADIGEWVEVGSAMDLSSIHIVEVGAQEEGCGFGHFTGGSCHRVTCEEEAVAALGKMLAHRQISMASVEQLETYQLHLKIMDKQIDYARRKELAKTIAPPIEIQYIAQTMRMTTTESQEDVSVHSPKVSIGTAWTEDITSNSDADTYGSVSTFSSSGDDSDDDSVSTYHDFGTDDVSDSFNGIAEEFDDREHSWYTVPWFESIESRAAPFEEERPRRLLRPHLLRPVDSLVLARASLGSSESRASPSEEERPRCLLRHNLLRPVDSLLLARQKWYGFKSSEKRASPFGEERPRYLLARRNW
jgi:hypothetical protein